ncbi:MAG TPA: hypothetical protein VMV09_00045 [Candidatus Saccharimonadales bacterium]|nr:hypothetical protein [Candidatus Saccharimonadales bacterium]
MDADHQAELLADYRIHNRLEDAGESRRSHASEPKYELMQLHVKLRHPIETRQVCVEPKGQLKNSPTRSHPAVTEYSLTAPQLDCKRGCIDIPDLAHGNLYRHIRDIENPAIPRAVESIHCVMCSTPHGPDGEVQPERRLWLHLQVADTFTGHHARWPAPADSWLQTEG